MPTLAKTKEKTTVVYRVQVTQTFDNGLIDIWLNPTLYKSKHKAFVAAEWYTMPIIGGFSLGQVIIHTATTPLYEGVTP